MRRMNSEHGRVDRIAPQRHAMILEHLQREGAASIHDLVGVVRASQSTIRRDLEQLVASGYLERAYGGAVLPRGPRSTFEPSFAVATGLASEAKRAIGEFAAMRIQSGHSVMFDSSSTVLEAARAVARRGTAITAVTNDLAIARLLADFEHIRVVVPGGSVRPGSLTLAGEPGPSFLRTIHTDIAFIGCHAITDGTLTETSLDVAAMKQAIIAASQQTIALADSSKFRTPAFATICNLEDIDEVITDLEAPPATMDRLRDHGIAVTAVPATE